MTLIMMMVSNVTVTIVPLLQWNLYYSLADGTTREGGFRSMKKALVGMTVILSYRCK